jgi:hypothetical protein
MKAESLPVEAKRRSRYRGRPYGGLMADSTNPKTLVYGWALIRLFCVEICFSRPGGYRPDKKPDMSEC